MNTKEPVTPTCFEREYTETGRNGRFTATVRATMNCGFNSISGTTAVTHDDYEKRVPTHKVEVFINEKLYRKVEEIMTEESVLFETQKAKNEALSRIHALANDEPVKTFRDKIGEILS